MLTILEHYVSVFACPSSAAIWPFPFRIRQMQQDSRQMQHTHHFAESVPLWYLNQADEARQKAPDISAMYFSVLPVLRGFPG